MNTTSKIIATVIAIVIFLFLFAMLIQLSGGNPKAGGSIFGLLLGFGLIAAIRTIWKKQPKDNNNLNKN